MTEILRITGAFGIRGAVRAFSFSKNLSHYKEIVDARGNSLRFKVIKFCGKDRVVLLIEGVNDRNAAEALKRESFYVRRRDLPETKPNEVYVCDLVGKDVKIAGSPIKCKIIGLENFGAGDLAEISCGDATFMVPFTAENFPDVDGEILMTAEAFERFKN
ncbi:MAG: ribosome maturation factor RimM [Holosporaceae bacterium]|nr:ribosome maturation factor RimM [Holosporaceae bacterium]